MAMSNKVKPLEIVREDDYVEYFLFPKINGNDIPKEDEEFYLNKCLIEVKNIIKEYSSNYFWHKDKINIIPIASSCQILLNEEFINKDHLPPHLYGIVHYGDNNEDEWFIVFLLLQLTKLINGLAIRVVDSDGEFLLIETANFLPAWANPETCEKRVFLYKGQVHIVPLNQSNMQNQIEVIEALSIIYNEPLLTEASTNIQNAISERVNGYPGKINELLHRTKVYLPVGVAAILNHKPELISSAVISFRNRDPIDMKACRAMKYFPPENRVYSTVTFTKCLYAMLHHSNYNPDRKIGWNLPDTNSPQFKSHNLGVKIACGFEILAAQAKTPNDIENDKAWNIYLESLREKNYFNNNLEHSQEYNNLLNKAKEYFKSQKILTNCSSAMGQEILELNRKLDYSADDFKKFENSLPEDNSESWLEISVQELDKMLTERYSQNNILNANGQIEPSVLTGKLTEFLDNESSIDGVEFPENSTAPTRPQRGIKRNKEKSKVSFSKDTKTENSSTTNDTNINFDPSTFTCAVQNILDLVIPEDSWDSDSDSEMSEYADESDSELDKMDMSKVNTNMKKYMHQMDQELAGTTVGKSFEKKKSENDTFDDIESFQPVDIDMTALKNILQSYQSQMGAAGPASNMLGPMGIHLEPGCSSNNKNVE